MFREFVEWRDNSSPSDVLHVKFTQIKGQRVSQPQKSKVQLQLVFQDDEKVGHFRLIEQTTQHANYFEIFFRCNILLSYICLK